GIVYLAPITPNSQVPGWLVVGTSNQVWESNDMGATVSRIPLLGDTACNATATVSLAAAGCDLVRALAYGGMFSGTPAPNVLYIAFIPTGTGTDGVVLVGTDIGVLGTAMKTDTVWSVFGSTLPRTFAFSVVYDSTEDMLMVGTLGRGAFELPNASTAASAGSQLWGAAPDDIPFTVDVPLDVKRP